ncbi:MAG: SAM-dependent DNA methyltransferase [Planctomycetaceae bacterium]|nr:SAM-dependent DNA methyltransferase [Planctomycetaceae bacterium]
MISAGIKERGAYFTPLDVAQSLVRWAVRSSDDRLLDPSCGDGQFLALHPNAVGVEWDAATAGVASQRSPGSIVHVGDFFDWAARTQQRFQCAVGNPPFIRYQRFNGETRRRALEHCGKLGVRFSALSSSWAPFLTAAAGCLASGGRMAFVVPAEIGHAPYARPLVRFLCQNFDVVHLIAIRERLFPTLSQDAWLLYADGYTGSTEEIRLTALDRFRSSASPPRSFRRVPVARWEAFSHRVRPFLLPDDTLDLYQASAASKSVCRLGSVAKVGIGYVTGANDFFHLRPSEARGWDVPSKFLLPAVRSGRSLPPRTLEKSTVENWLERDEACLLLRVTARDELPVSVKSYLDSPEGEEARETYKCRNRDPWHVVPDVTVPDAFLSYMSGAGPSLVENRAGCVGTNSVHVVRLRGNMSLKQLQRSWDHPLSRLSVEIEGHPLGGGMLKVEPGEAARVVVPRNGRPFSADELNLLDLGRRTLMRWRHYDA